MEVVVACFRHYSSICLEELRKITKILCQMQISRPIFKQVTMEYESVHCLVDKTDAGMNES
jgi:hypothetical protein